MTIHPFDDGNGRIARATADWQLARSERSAQRFYSMSAQTWGHGLVPVNVALLPGATTVVLDGVGHGPVLSPRWYGSGEVVQAWWRLAAAG